MRIVGVLVLLVVGIAACSKQETPSAFEGLSAAAAIDSLWTGYAHASDKKDSTAFATLFTEDAVLMVSNAATVTGGSAVAAFLTKHYAPVDPTGLRVQPDQTRLSGTLAVQTGGFQEDYLDAKGYEKTGYGRYVLVAERGDKDVWKIRCLTAMADSTK